MSGSDAGLRMAMPSDDEKNGTSAYFSAFLSRDQRQRRGSGGIGADGQGGLAARQRAIGRVLDLRHQVRFGGEGRNDQPLGGDRPGLAEEQHAPRTPKKWK